MVKWKKRDSRAIGFGEEGDSVGVDDVVNEGGNGIRGFDLWRSGPFFSDQNQENNHRERRGHAAS